MLAPCDKQVADRALELRVHPHLLCPQRPPVLGIIAGPQVLGGGLDIGPLLPVAASMLVFRSAVAACRARLACHAVPAIPMIAANPVTIAATMAANRFRR